MADDIVTNIYFSLGEGQSVEDILSRLRNRYPDVVHPHLLADAELIGSAADEIVRLRAVLDAIDALHTPRWRNPLSGKPTWCRECEAMWPCPTHLLIHPDVPA